MFRVSAACLGLTLALFSGQLFGQVSLPYETDFEAAEGFIDSSAPGQSPWVVGNSGAKVTTTEFTSDSQGVVLPLNSNGFLTATFAGGVTDAVTFVDFYLKPAAGPFESLPLSATDVTSSMSSLIDDAGTGWLYVVQGDGLGGGEWLRVPTEIPLTDGVASSWMRFTYRLDYASKTWDLYLDEKLVATDIQFLDNVLTSFGEFRLRGGGMAPVYFDFFYAGYENPVFIDSDKDGMSDAYESANGLDPFSDDRYGDKDFDGIPNIHEFLRDLEAGNPDTDGDGVHDGWELSAGANPLVADPYDLNNLPFADSFEEHPGLGITTFNGWKFEGEVEPEITEEEASQGTKSAKISGGTTDPVQLYNLFESDPQEIVWVDFSIKSGALTTEPSLGAKTSAGFYFGESGRLMAFDGSVLPLGAWKELDHEPVEHGQWRRITVRLNYATQRWSLYLDNTRVAHEFGFANPVPYFSSIGLLEQANKTSYLDAVSIGYSEPAGLDNDGDGLSNAEEDINGNGIVDIGETDPELRDTDGDGIDDRLDIRLRLWLSADYGVTTGTGGEVTAWNALVGSAVQQSTSQNQPVLTANALAGKPVITFDGANDFLSGSVDFNPNDEDFTIVMVHRRSGGHDYAAPISFSTETSSTGAPLLRYGPDANHFGINAVGLGADGTYVDLGNDYQNSAYISSVRRSGGTHGNGGSLSLRAISDGETHLAEGTQTWTSTGNGLFTLGRKQPSSSHYFGGDIAEVYVYEGALSDADIMTLEALLAQRYEISIDQDADGLFDEWERATFASLEYGYDDDPDEDGVNNWREYNLGTNANVAEAFDFISAKPDLKLWLNISNGLTLNGSLLAAWTDISGNANTASQDDPDKQPLLTAFDAEGHRFVRFDGANDFLESASNFDPGAGDFTLIAVTSQRSDNGLSATLSYSTTDEAIGAPLLRWNRPSTGDLGINEVGLSTEGAFVSLPDASRQNLTIVSARRTGGTPGGQGGMLTVRALSDMMTLESESVQNWISGPSSAYYVGRKKFSDEGNNDYYSGDVAEIIAFDSALTDEVLLEIEEYLGAKYGLTLDVDADGIADAIERQYFADLSQGPDDDSDGDGLSNIRELNLGMNPAVADEVDPILLFESLVAWFDAGSGVTSNGSQAVSQWMDRSGYQVSLSQASGDAQPLLSANTANDFPALSFDGVDDFIDGDATFDPGTSDFTIYVVHRRNGGHDKAATWSFNTPSGLTGAPLLRWGPDANHLGINAVGTGPEGAYVDLGPSYPDRLFVTTVSRTGGASGQGGTLKVFTEGYTGRFNAEETQSWISSASSLLALGRKDANSGHFFGGDIAEVLVFESELTAQERSILNDYLIEKYNLSADRDGDGLLNNQEDINLNGIVDEGETDANNPDSDGDGMVDGLEVLFGHDPLLADINVHPEEQSDGSLKWSVSFEFEEGFSPGDLDGQNGWVAGANATVTNLAAADGQQSIALAGEQALAFITAGWNGVSDVWVSFHAKPIPATLPEVYESELPMSAVFGLDKQGHIAAWDATQATWVLSADTVDEDTWVDFDVNLNYSTKQWNLLVGGTGLFWGLPFNDASLPHFARFVMRNLANTPEDEVAYLDALTISNTEPAGLDFDGDGLDNQLERSLGSDVMSSDSDSDGMPDAWEYEHGFVLTTNDANGDPDGDLLWNIDEYKHGLDPHLADLDSIQNVAIGDIWYGITGTSVSNLTNNSRFPLNPDRRTLWDSLTSENSEGGESNYGQRIRGIITAPVTGDYTFWIASDDRSELWLSSDDTTFNKTPIATVNGTTEYHDWDRYESQRSYPVSLVEGQEYYFEVLHKEGTGDDHVAVSWEYPGQEQEIIPGAHLKRYNSHPNDLDEDGLSDDWETANGLDPTKGYGINGYNGDADGDGLVNYLERDFGTNPLLADSDGDGYDDWTEVFELETDPNVPEPVTWELVQTINGAEAIPVFGEWEVNDTASVVSGTGGGKANFEVSFTEDGVYQFKCDFSRLYDSPSSNGEPTVFLWYIDGEYLGKTEIDDESGTASFIATKRTPYLLAGEHTVSLRWINVYRRHEIGINTLTIEQATAGSQETWDEWLFEYISRDATLETPLATSYVSPLNIEGQGRYLNLIEMTPVVPIMRGGLERWFADVDLNESGPTDISISFQNGGKVVSETVEWVPTNVFELNEITIRKGDSLKLSAYYDQDPGGTFSIAINGQSLASGLTDYVVHAFDTSGEYTITGTYTTSQGAIHEDSLMVTVIGVDSLPNSPALWAARSRSFTWPGLPAGVTVEAPGMYLDLESQTQSSTKYTIRRDEAYEDVSLVARLGEGGPILTAIPTQGFWLRASVEGYLIATEIDEETLEVRNDIIVYNLPEPVDVKISVFKAGVVLDDGSRTRLLTAEDFDELGRYSFYMLKPTSVNGGSCHRIQSYQNGSYIGTR